MDAKRIIVVGAGPAGMMAAIQAASAGGNVLLLEKNSCLGKKLLLSGKGRCNLTNACDLDVFLSRFSHTSAFLRDAFKAFFHVQLVDFFQSRGVAMKVERQGRVFPVSDKSSSVVKALEHALRHAKVDVRMKTATKDVSVKGDRLQGVVLSDGSILAGDRVILATGGMSYAATGSTGEGMCMAKHLGHRISVLRPGLVPLVLKEPFPRLLEGLTLKNIRLCFFQDNKRKES
ncbi:MAG: aminoacetone oxidase family FAD-binding enzyme, partial [Candidatus Omnitrophica bacterium]|nr:aminoacetone oxidase family FAD-binding enzyme [Candidatus Omnitrophota bacterium]